MAKKSKGTSHGLPGLLFSRAEAEERIREQIEKGVVIHDQRINSGDHLNGAKADKAQWTEYTAGLLRNIFDDESVAVEFSRARKITIMGGGTTIFEMIDDFKEDVSGAIDYLRSVIQALAQAPEKKAKPAKGAAAPQPDKSANVLIVHGLDDISKEAVASLIRKLGLNPVVLHEQSDMGRSLIKKFDGVAFAVVLLTPDELGTPRDVSRKLTPRPRALQDVIFAHGFLIGKLGEEKVCALYREEVEVPAGYDGAKHIKLDALGAWGLKLAKEIKKAGLDVDLNGVE